MFKVLKTEGKARRGEFSCAHGGTVQTINLTALKNVMVADGCVIEGEIENSILFRGVKVAKGAKVKNCILMQDTVIEAGAEIEYVVSDKYVTVSEGKQLKGTDSFPVFIAKDQVV